MGMLAVVILTGIIIFGIATMWYSSGEAAFFISLVIIGLLFLWDLSSNQGQLMMTPVLMIGNWLGIRLWTALFLYMTFLGSYVFGTPGKVLVVIVFVLIVLHALGVLGPIKEGDLSALKGVIKIGGG